MCMEDDFWKVARNRIWDVLIYRMIRVEEIEQSLPPTAQFSARIQRLQSTSASNESADNQSDSGQNLKIEHISNKSDVPTRRSVKKAHSYFHVFEIVDGESPPIDEAKFPNPICRKMNKFTQAMARIIKHNSLDQQDLLLMNLKIIREKVYNAAQEYNPLIDRLIEAFDEYYEMTNIDDITTENILSFLQEKGLCSFSMEDLKQKRAPRKEKPANETVETIEESYKTENESCEEEEEDGNEDYPAVNISKEASKRDELPEFLSDFNWREKVKQLRMIHDYNPKMDISDLQGPESVEVQPLIDINAEFETYSEDELDEKGKDDNKKEDKDDKKQEEEESDDDSQEEEEESDDDNQEEEGTFKEEEDIHEEVNKDITNETKTKRHEKNDKKQTKTQMILTVHEFFNTSYADIPDKKINESFLGWKEHNKDRLIFDPSLKTLYSWRRQKLYPKKNKDQKVKKHRGGYRKPKVLTNEVFECLLTIHLAFPFLTAKLKRLYLLAKVESCKKILIRSVQDAMTKMGFVRKKSHPFVYQRNSLGRIALRAFWARRVIKIFENHGFLPVFVDEASIQIQTGSKLIMSYRGTNLAQFEPSKHRHVSIIAAVVPGFGVSLYLAYGSIKQMSYKIFIKQVNNKLRTSVCESETNVIFINDNATIHKITDSKKDDINEKTDLLFTIPYSPQTNAGAENLFSFIKGKMELLDSNKFIGLDDNKLISELKKELLKILNDENIQELTMGWYANTVAQWKRCAQCLPLSTYKIKVDKSDDILNLDITTSRVKKDK